MLRMNLATRPFYNERAVHVAVGVVAAVSLLVVLAGAWRFRELSTVHATMTAAAQEDEERANELRQLAVTLQREIGASEREVLRAATGEANQLIDQRVFSWTEFLNLIEATLPMDVRLTSIRPSVDAGEVTVAIGVLGRTVADIFGFVEQLEATGAFSGVLPVEEEMTDEGMYRTILVGQYAQLTPGDLATQPVEAGASVEATP